MYWNRVTTTGDHRMHSEERIYRDVLNQLRSSLADLDYCFASDEVKEALREAILMGERDWASRVERSKNSSTTDDS